MTPVIYCRNRFFLSKHELNSSQSTWNKMFADFFYFSWKTLVWKKQTKTSLPAENLFTSWHHRIFNFNKINFESWDSFVVDLESTNKNFWLGKCFGTIGWTNERTVLHSPRKKVLRLDEKRSLTTKLTHHSVCLYVCVSSFLFMILCFLSLWKSSYIHI